MPSLLQKPAKREDRRQRQPADDKEPERLGQLAAQPAHLAHILLARQRVNHRARRHEEQRLEVGVGGQVEDAAGEAARGLAHKHVAKLAHRRIGQHALDIGLHAGDGRGEERGRPADDADDRQRSWGRAEDDRAARHQIDARRHHRRRVDQRAHRRRAFHRVGQPDMQRQLRRLRRRRHEEQQRDGGDCGCVNRRQRGIRWQRERAGRCECEWLPK